MEIIGIEAKDIHVTFKMSLTDIIKLRDALNITELDTRGDPRKQEAANFLVNEFFPFVKELATKGSGNDA